MAELISVSFSPQPDTSLHCETGVQAVYVPAFTDTHSCTYPGRDGQAEFTWVAGYTPR